MIEKTSGRESVGTLTAPSLGDPVFSFHETPFFGKQTPPIQFAAMRPELPHTRLLEMPVGYVDSI